MINNKIFTERLADGVVFLGIPDKNRKTNRFTIAAISPLREKNASKNAVLPFLLKRGCREYPDFSAFNEKLAMLYGATVRGGIQKLGDNSVITLTISAIDDKFALDGEKISKECANLLCSLLFDPNFENDMFVKSDLDTEKRQLIEKIEAEINNKRTYAKNRAIEIMCDGEPFGVNPLGEAVKVSNLTLESVTRTWEKLLAKSRFAVIATGPADFEPAINEFKSRFSQITRDYKPLPDSIIIPSAMKVSDHVERTEVQQAKLILGFRCRIAEPDEKVPAMRLFAALFGGTPHSRLFLNVREKLSLCYYCAARYDRIKGIMTVECGLDEVNKDKAKEEILNQLEIIRSGDFENSEIESAKMSYKNALISSYDSPAELEGWYLGQVLGDKYESPENAAEQIENVTREDIINAAGMVSLDTVYILAGNEVE